jgi:hypothetical protein
MSRPEAIPLGQETPNAFLYSLNALVPDVKLEIATSNSNLLQAVVRRRMRFPLGGHGRLGGHPPNASVESRLSPTRNRSGSITSEKSVADALQAARA